MEEFQREGIDGRIATDDGSAGHHGFVTDLLRSLMIEPEPPAAIYCCGPEPMMHAVSKLAIADSSGRGSMSAFHDPRREAEKPRSHLAVHDKPIGLLIGAGGSSAVTGRTGEGAVPAVAPLTVRSHQA